MASRVFQSVRTDVVHPQHDPPRLFAGRNIPPLTTAEDRITQVNNRGLGPCQVTPASHQKSWTFRLGGQGGRVFLGGTPLFLLF